MKQIKNNKEKKILFRNYLAVLENIKYMYN